MGNRRELEVRTAQFKGFLGPAPTTAFSSGAIQLFPGVEEYVEKTRKGIIQDSAFRVEFAGDFVIDCGHEPLSSEIHPPNAILFHASIPQMTDRKRYSVFAYTRPGDEAPTFDLWPGVRPKGKNQIAYEILSPSNDTVFKNTLQCQPYPSGNPNRVRCTLPPGQNVGNESICKDNSFEGLLLPTNPRMIPSCSTNVGGALIEVRWQ
jgi:hypothetical protein